MATRFLKGKHPTKKSRLINLESISHIEYIAGMLVARESLIQEVQDSEGAICEAMERLNVRSHFSGNNGALPLGEGQTARVQIGDEPRSSTAMTPVGSLLETTSDRQHNFEYSHGDRNGTWGRDPGEMYEDIAGETGDPGGSEEEEAAAWLFGGGGCDFGGAGYDFGGCEALGADF